jgi:hypothetical protein
MQKITVVLKKRVTKQAKIEQRMKKKRTSCLQVVVKKVKTSHEVSIAVGKDALVSILGVSFRIWNMRAFVRDALRHGVSAQRGLRR